ncbi:MAG: sigma-70 family RNA polymerase sigma factor [Sedimentisphaerales bacterium]|nr:sigma-70 family RNA polymerase sigma factor [Sedimentisphaerales bacterium]
MFGKAVRCELLWDFAVSGTVDKSQQWIISAMSRYGQELVTMLWRILGNEQDVCDAYQSTFLQLAHYSDRQKPRHVKAYIFRTATNIAISLLRTRIAEKNRLSKNVRIKKNIDSPAEQLDSKSLVETLRFHMAQLPAHLRDVVMLRDLGELSYVQIAEMLGISSATARVYRCKAIQLLAVWMGKERE